MRAKDGQRPHVMRRVFGEQARFVSRYDFETKLSSESPVHGLEGITDVFRGLGNQAENIYTLYIEDSVEQRKDGLAFRWIVGMSERGSRSARVAWDYLWQFSEQHELATDLQVWMRAMVTLPPESVPGIMKGAADAEGAAH